METVQTALWVVVLLVVLAILFDFMNGFHDAANSIATVVSTGVLKPGQAVLFAAFFNVVAILVFHLSVAATVGKGIVQPGVVDTHVVFGALVGAITWNVLTWYYGIPSSSSHALIGGIVGAVIAKAGASALVSAGILKTVAFIFVSPLLGFVLGSLMMVVVAWLFRRSRPSKVDKWFRRLQLVSAGAYSLGHGGNDAQKTIGIIWMLLIATGYSAAADKSPPTWVILTCYAAIGAGTMFGGWRIVKTMGQKITKLKPVGGFCAETGGALTLFLATGLGIPVSTTHTITGAIVGVGSVQRASAVRWGVAGNIVWAWIFTIPASAFVAAIAYWISLKLVLAGIPRCSYACPQVTVRAAAGNASTRLLLGNLARLGDLVLEVALKAEGDAGHQDGGADQQRQRNGAYRQPTGLARCRIRTGAWIEPQVPFLGSHQPVHDGLQGASGDGEAQQGHENPAQSVVLAQLLNPLNAIQTESGWNRQQPAQPVAEAVQVEAVQPQRPSQKGEPSRQCLVFHAVIIAAKSCHPGPETAPSAPRQASGRISSRTRRARPHAENPERDARRSSRCCPSRR
jgi:PiT family inorganic phosphate transporter